MMYERPVDCTAQDGQMARHLSAATPAGPAGSCGRPTAACAEDLMMRNDDFVMWLAKVIPCRKGFPHDWARCPHAHATDAARRRDPQMGYRAVACPRMKQEGRCKLGDSCPYTHNLFEYWLHPSRYHTQICKDGATCRRALCFFAHDLKELRIPDCKPASPASMQAAAAAAVAALQQAGGSGAAPLQLPQQQPDGRSSAVQQRDAQSRQHGSSMQFMDATAGSQPAEQAQPLPAAEGGCADVARLVLRLLERGELGPDKSAAILQQLLPPAALGQLQLQAELASSDACRWETRCYSDPVSQWAGCGAASSQRLVPAAEGLQGRAASLDSAAAHGSMGLALAPAPCHPAPLARLAAAQQGPPPGATLHPGQLAALQQLGGTAAGRLMAAGGQILLPSVAEQGPATLQHSQWSRLSLPAVRSSFDALAGSTASPPSWDSSPAIGSPSAGYSGLGAVQAAGMYGMPHLMRMCL